MKKIFLIFLIFSYTIFADFKKDFLLDENNKITKEYILKSTEEDLKVMVGLGGYYLQLKNPIYAENCKIYNEKGICEFYLKRLGKDLYEIVLTDSTIKEINKIFLNNKKLVFELNKKCFLIETKNYKELIENVFWAN